MGSGGGCEVRGVASVWELFHGGNGAVSTRSNAAFVRVSASSPHSCRESVGLLNCNIWTEWGMSFVCLIRRSCSERGFLASRVKSEHMAQ